MMTEVEFWTKQLEMAEAYGLTAGYELSKLKKAKAKASPTQLIQIEIDRLEAERAATTIHQESSKIFFMVQGLKRAIKVIEAT